MGILALLLAGGGGDDDTGTGTGEGGPDEGGGDSSGDSLEGEPAGGGTDTIPGTPTGGGDTPDAGGGIQGPGQEPVTPDAGPTPAATVAKYHSLVPVPGSLYLIHAGNTAAGIAGQVGAADKPKYVQRMTSVSWNRKMYSTPYQPGASGWPSYYASGGRVLRFAFNPRHADVLAELRAGQTPTRKIGPNGQGQNTGHYALVWLPPLAGNPNPPADLRALMGDMA